MSTENRSIVFRVDSSASIGLGHLFRCLTLAEALRSEGFKCKFISCELWGNRIDIIRSRGFDVSVLRYTQTQGSKECAITEVRACDWILDAAESSEILANIKVGWLVVDHYALDFKWENHLRYCAKNFFVIDDLANRKHDADFLLDQNLGRIDNDYRHLVSDKCELLIGGDYALLRPEFSRLRKYSLARRKVARTKKIIISMGGTDPNNVTGQLLGSIRNLVLPSDSHITVIMGKTAPWLNMVREAATLIPYRCEIKVDVENMAELLAKSDLAIGAAGISALERCCLGLPSLLMAIADNQIAGAEALAKLGGCIFLSNTSLTDLQNSISRLQQKDAFFKMSQSASNAVDGLGLTRIIAIFKSVSK